MKQIKFSLPVQQLNEGDPPQMGLTFISYLTKQIHLNPGDSCLETIRDTAVGLYDDWTDQDIRDYYETRYADYGLEVEIIQDGPNYP